MQDHPSPSLSSTDDSLYRMAPKKAMHASECRYAQVEGNERFRPCPPSLRQIIRAANGLQHIQFSGGTREGSFRLWAGGTDYEEAEFPFEFSWDFGESDHGFRVPSRYIVPLCELWCGRGAHAQDS